MENHIANQQIFIYISVAFIVFDATMFMVNKDYQILM